MSPPFGLFNAAESLASSSSLVSHLMGMGDREQSDYSGPVPAAAQRRIDIDDTVAAADTASSKDTSSPAGSNRNKRKIRLKKRRNNNPARGRKAVFNFSTPASIEIFLKTFQLVIKYSNSIPFLPINFFQFF